MNPAEALQCVQRAWERCYPDRAARPELPQPEFQGTCGVGQFLNIMPNGDVFPCHVLTHWEFRCGNVLSESLLSICRRNGLLGELAAADFGTLALSDDRVADLTRPGACMGAVYAKTRELPIWKAAFPGLGGNSRSSKPPRLHG